MGRKKASYVVSMISVKAGGGGGEALPCKRGGEGHRCRSAKQSSSHPACISYLLNVHSGINSTPFVLERVHI